MVSFGKLKSERSPKGWGNGEAACNWIDIIVIELYETHAMNTPLSHIHTYITPPSSLHVCVCYCYKQDIISFYYFPMVFGNVPKSSNSAEADEKGAAKITRLDA